MNFFNFESRNVPQHFIRHRNFLGELTPRDTIINDFAFALVPRGTGVVALRSRNFPDRCLRHSNLRVRLDPPASPQDDLWRLDSSFTLVRGLADRTAFTFRSVNYPDRYLRHRDFHLWVEAPAGAMDDLFRNDATFYRRPAAVPFD